MTKGKKKITACRTCLYFDGGPYGQTGGCHRKPPGVFPRPSEIAGRSCVSFETIFPTLYWFEFCGDWKENDGSIVRPAVVKK